MQIKEQSVQTFSDQLASSSPTPGGGSAAAVTGTIAAALVSMVCNLTLGKKRFAEVEDELRAVLEQAEALRHKLADLADADTHAFDQVMAAYRLPRETDEERVARENAIQAALRQATQTPLETAIACATVVQLTGQVIDKINPSAVSDAGSAALLAEASLRGAQLNVVINLAGIHDAGFVQAKQRELDRVLDNTSQEKERIFSYALGNR